MPRSTESSKPCRAALACSASVCYALVATALHACVALPPAPSTADLSSLDERYDHPTGSLPDEITSDVLGAARPFLDVASQLDGLSLIRTAVADTSEGLAAALATDSLTVQGSIKAKLSCPGHGAMATDDAENNGTIDVTMGVADTRIQRALSGAATDCRFLSNRGGNSARITFSADLIADLGADIALGDDPSKALSVELSKLELSTDSGLSLPKVQDKYDFRVTDAQSIEVLLDPSALGLGLQNVGTVVLISHLDGAVGLREKRGEWRCPADDACSFKKAR